MLTVLSPLTGVNPTRLALKTGCSRRQSKQRIEAAAVGGQLRHLLSGNDVADFAGVGLHGDGIGFNRDLLLRAADLKLEVDAGPVADVEGDPSVRHP